MKLKGWRKIAGAMWRPPDDPQVYGILEFDATPLLAYMARARVAGHRVTPTHFVGRAIACALHDVPDFNVRIRGSRVIPRETVDVFFIAAVEGGRELSGVKVERADEKSVLAVAEELRGRATAMKGGNDPDFARTKGSISAMPRILLRPAMRLSSWVAGDLNRDLKLVGAKANPFGSPWVVDRRVKVRPILSLTATIDHRYADGWHISQLIRPFRRYLEDPAAFEPQMPPAGPTESEEARVGERQAMADQSTGPPAAEDRGPVA
jgi:pyruvate/2-oxoglutarate dehydrogenase complex dihydrolipoamide acyltransferase (E2) component